MEKLPDVPFVFPFPSKKKKHLHSPVKYVPYQLMFYDCIMPGWCSSIVKESELVFEAP